MNRRGFLGTILAAGVAPAFVRASSLMQVASIVLPTDSEVAAVISGNRLLTISEITNEALLLMEKNLHFCDLVSERTYRHLRLQP